MWTILQMNDRASLLSTSIMRVGGKTGKDGEHEALAGPDPGPERY